MPSSLIAAGPCPNRLNAFRLALNYGFVETNVEGALGLAGNFGNPLGNLPSP